MPTDRIAILGANGMLGSAVSRVCRETGRGVTLFSEPDWDILSDADLARAVEAADIVINCVGFTNVDGAECEADLAFAVNGTAVGKLAQLAKEKDKYLIHISTDYVFDGMKSGAYCESDAPAPLGVYAASKVDGERQFTTAGCDGCIVRLQWTYGTPGEHFISKVIARAATSNVLRVVDDQIGAPTAVTDVAAALLALADRRLHGLYHYAARGSVSRFAMAQHIVDRLNLLSTVEPCKTAEFANAAPRPLNSTFDCSKFDRDTGIERPQWQEPFDAYLNQLEKGT